DLRLGARIGDHVRRAGVIAVKPAYVLRIGLAVGVRRAVVRRGRANSGERPGRGQTRGGELDVLEPRRRGLIARQTAEALRRAFARERFLLRARAFALAAPSEMLETRLAHDRVSSNRSAACRARARPGTRG